MNLSKMNRRRFSGGVTFGDVTYPPGGSFGPRVQQDFQLVALIEGGLSLEVDGQEMHLGENQAVLMWPLKTEHYRFAPDRASRHTWVAIQTHLVDGGTGERLAGLTRPFALSPRIRGLLEYGLGFPDSPLPEAHAALDSLALTLLRCLVFEQTLGQSAEQLPAGVQRARAFMEARLGQPLTLEQVARAAHLTPQHLTRLFRRHLGVTPMRHLWQLRTERGAALLRESGLSVGAIAEQLGFGSPFHFSRLIRRAYGLPPRELRKGWWKGG